MTGSRQVAALVILLVAGGCTEAGAARSPTPRPTLVTHPPIQAPTSLPMPSRTRDIPSSIDASGATDVAGELQALIDSAPDGTAISFPEGAIYRIETGLQINARSDLRFEGNGSTLLSAGCGADGAAFSIGRRGPSTGIAIVDLAIEGANEQAGSGDAFDSACEHAHGVSIHQSSDIEIAHVDISRVHGDCVYVGGGGFERSEGVNFHDSTCSLTGRQGVAITAGRDVHVERVRFDEIAIMAFDIEPNAAVDGAEDIVFVDNSVGRTGVSDEYGPMFFGANGNLDAEVRNVRVVNNVSTGGPLTTLVGDEDKGWSGGRNHHDISFVGNRSPVPADGPVLRFKHVDGLTVFGNVQPLSSGELVDLDDTINANVR